MLKICNSFYRTFSQILFLHFLHSAQAQEREKSYETIIREEQTQYINMADITHHYDVIGYRDKRIQDTVMLNRKQGKYNIQKLSVANL